MQSRAPKGQIEQAACWLWVGTVLMKLSGKRTLFRSRSGKSGGRNISTACGRLTIYLTTTDGASACKMSANLSGHLQRRTLV